MADPIATNRLMAVAATADGPPRSTAHHRASHPARGHHHHAGANGRHLPDHMPATLHHLSGDQLDGARDHAHKLSHALAALLVKGETVGPADLAEHATKLVADTGGKVAPQEVTAFIARVLQHPHGAYQALKQAHKEVRAVIDHADAVRHFRKVGQHV